MRKIFLTLVLCLATTFILYGQEKLSVYNAGSVLFETELDKVNEITFKNSTSTFYLQEDNVSMLISKIDSITFSTEPVIPSEIVYVLYDGAQVSVVNPYGTDVIRVVNNGAHLTLTSISAFPDIEYHVSGITTDGSFSISSQQNIKLTLEDLQITSLSSPAVNIGSAVTTSVELKGDNRLTDADTNAKNNAFASKGDLRFLGDGKLTLQANKKNGISSDTALQIDGGNITIACPIADGKAIKCEETLSINGGILSLTASGNQTKALSGKGGVIFNGGETTIVASGSTVLETSGSGYDPSYCTAVKTQGDLLVNAGSIQITLPSSNAGGKGLSADGKLEITGGTIAISTAGNGATYKNSTGTTDSYTSCCIKSDGDLSILAGNISCISSGTGGKGISTDTTMIIGIQDASDEDLTLSVKTSGERFSVSGSGNNADYANPKAIKSTGNMTINSGSIIVSCTQTNEGGEGIESKATLTINGGNIEVEAKDDCINASKHIQINGGKTYCHSSGNDAIDSNGTITITGGLTIAAGTSNPEAGFDCDNYTFSVTGGTIIGTGGTTSNPSSSTRYFVKSTNVTPGNTLCLKDAAGEIIMLYQLPTYSTTSGGNQGGGNRPGGGGSSSSSMVFLFSDPALTKGSTYTLSTGGTISGGTTVNGYTTGGTYSGGTSKSFTISATTTTVSL